MTQQIPSQSAQDTSTPGLRRRLTAQLHGVSRVALVRIGAVVLSLLLVALVFWLAGYPLSDVAYGVWQGAVAAPGAWQSTLRWAMAYMVIGAGVIVALRAGFFNIGAQGQFYVGACAAVAVPLYWTGGPVFLVVVASIAAAMTAGALWALGPGWLRVRFGTDEVITTLMANFLAILVLRWLTSGPLQDPAGSGESTSSRKIDDAFRISSGNGVSIWTVGICAVSLVAVWLLLNRTSFGLLSGLTGRNPLMARWLGVNVRSIGLLAFLVSGALAGLYGAMEVTGSGGRVSSGFAPGLGFTAILVAVVAGLSIVGLIFAALFFGALQAALLYLPIVTDVPPSSLDMLRGLVALFVTASPFVLVLLLRGSVRGERP